MLQEVKMTVISSANFDLVLHGLKCSIGCLPQEKTCPGGPLGRECTLTPVMYQTVTGRDALCAKVVTLQLSIF